MNALKEIKVILFDDIKQSFKSKKIIVLLIIFFLMMVISAKFGHFLDVKKSEYWAIETWLKMKFAAYLPYLAALIILPFIALLLSYNSINEEKNDGSVRYIINKIRRSSFVIGKFLSPVVVLLFISFALMTGLYFWSNALGAYDVATKGVFLWLFSSSFAALSIFVSSATRKPIKSLLFLILLMVIMFVMLFIKKIKILSLFNYVYLNYASIPYSSILMVFAPLLIFLFLFLVLSLLVFQRCDL